MWYKRRRPYLFEKVLRLQRYFVRRVVLRRRPYLFEKVLRRNCPYPVKPGLTVGDPTCLRRYWDIRNLHVVGGSVSETLPVWEGIETRFRRLVGLQNLSETLPVWEGIETPVVPRINEGRSRRPYLFEKVLRHWRRTSLDRQLLSETLPVWEGIETMQFGGICFILSGRRPYLFEKVLRHQYSC